MNLDNKLIMSQSPVYGMSEIVSNKVQKIQDISTCADFNTICFSSRLDLVIKEVYK